MNLTKSLSKTHSAIEAFVGAGYRVTPLSGKKAIIEGWTKAPYEPFVDLSQFPGNYGVVLDRDMVVVDVDPRNYQDGVNSFVTLCARIGVDLRAMNTLIVRTGNNGYHFYFKKPADLDIVGQLNTLPGIEFRSFGKQMVGPGSIHPDTGKEYIIVHEGISTIAPAPQELLRLIHVVKKDPLKVHHKIDYVFDEQTIIRFKEFLEKTPGAVQGENGDAMTFKVAAMGKDLGLHPKYTFDLMLEFFNPRCTPPWLPDDLKRKVNNAYRYSLNSPGALHPFAEFTDLKPDVSKENLLWDVNEDGVTLKKTLRNTINMFVDPESELYGLLGFNEFTADVVLLKKAPWQASDETIYTWTDAEALRCKYWLAKVRRFEPQTTILHEAAVVAARYCSFHPVRHYLESLEWDRYPRLDKWLHTICGAPDDLYCQAVGAKSLIAAVARIYEPGCKFDYMLVLEGPQGSGKSTVCNLLGGLWYGDLTLDVGNKDVIDIMRGNWIIEISEMECTRRTETQALKAFLSRRVDRVRLAYARIAQDFQRQSVFIGTINPEADGGYLKDTTGNRRFWPVATTNINLDALRQIRDQLWAEAVVRYKAGATLYLENPDVLQMAVQEQAARVASDPWTEKIKEYVDHASNIVIMTSSEIYLNCIGGQLKLFGRRDAMRIAECMRTIGWEKGFFYDKVVGKTVSGFRRPQFEVKTEEDFDL